MESLNPYSPPSPDGMVQPTEIVPLTFGQVLSVGSSLYIQRFAAVMAITAVVRGPLELLQSYLEYFVFEGDDIGASLRLSGISETLAGLIVTGAVTEMGLRAINGEHVPWWTSIARGLR